LGNLDAGVDINRAGENMRKNIKISAKDNLGYYELKKHKQWHEKGCSELLHHRKKIKLHRLQEPSEKKMGII
jgi:hypothetical protein